MQPDARFGMGEKMNRGHGDFHPKTRKVMRKFRQKKQLLPEDKSSPAYIIFNVKKTPRSKILKFFIETFLDRRKLTEIEILFCNYFYGTKFKTGELSCFTFKISF